MDGIPEESFMDGCRGINKSISGKKGLSTTFIVLMVCLAIAVLLLIVNSDAFSGMKAVCRGEIGPFEYKCASGINAGQTECPEGWGIDGSKKCEEINDKVEECCYRQK